MSSLQSVYSRWIHRMLTTVAYLYLPQRLLVKYFVEKINNGNKGLHFSITDQIIGQTACQANISDLGFINNPL